MDNSAYVPNQLPPPLVVFSQAAAGFSDAALRMQRPFNPQIGGGGGGGGEGKDVGSPFGQAALDYRLHHMLQLQHQFLHPLEHRLPFGSSAFRPLGSLGGPLAPSAFAPPHKRPKLEAAAGSGESAPSTPTPSLPGMFSPQALPQQQQQQQQPAAAAAAASELAPHSPAHSHSSSRSPSAGTPAHQLAQLNAQLGQQDEEREASATPCSDNTDASSQPDEPRPYRMGHVFGGRCGAEALGLGLMSLNPAYRFALPPGLAAKTTRCLVFDQGKKKFNAEPQCCPVCGVTVRGQELEQHFLQELDRLYKLSSASARPRPARPSLPPAAPEHPHGQPMLHTPSAADGTPIGRWETYKRIKANRQARIRVKNRKRKADEPACPVCNERLSGSVEELNQHVERCLNKQNGNPDRHQLDDEEVDVEGDAETFEEYEWAGQRRVRASSMLLGGYSGLSSSGSERRSRAGAEAGGHEDEEMELVVDGDESAQFGPSQYGEADVVQPRLEGTAREQKEREALREAVISPNACSSQLQQQQQQQQQQQLEVKTEPSCAASPSSTSQQAEGRAEADDGPASSTSPPTSTMLLDAKSEPEAPVVEALRARVRELEAEMRTQPFKCLICMEQYKKPVTSVCCWHVHCEQCWLHTLGAKKLCPQCNMITSPSDLRRIYM